MLYTGVDYHRSFSYLTTMNEKGEIITHKKLPSDGEIIDFLKEFGEEMDETLNEGADYAMSFLDRSLIPWSQSRELTTSPIQLLLPEIERGATLAKSPSGCLSTKFLEELDHIHSSFNTFPFGMIKHIVSLLHETTITVSKVTFYINLLHPNSIFSPLGVQYVSELLQEVVDSAIMLVLNFIHLGHKLEKDTIMQANDIILLALFTYNAF